VPRPAVARPYRLHFSSRAAGSFRRNSVRSQKRHRCCGERALCDCTAVIHVRRLMSGYGLEGQGLIGGNTFGHVRGSIVDSAFGNTFGNW
jgi:hypothetical protein